MIYDKITINRLGGSEVKKVSRYRYKLVKSHLVEFEEELFYQKLTEILEKYAVIVGDFSGGQLRLKGDVYKRQLQGP